MKITEDTQGGTTILKIEGKLAFNNGDDELKQYASTMAVRDEKPQSLVLDMTGVTQVDSKGASAVVQTYVAMTQRGIVMRLVGASKIVTDHININGMRGMLQNHDTVEAAIATIPK
jgi:anti-anti-sigma factor